MSMISIIMFTWQKPYLYYYIIVVHMIHDFEVPNQIGCYVRLVIGATLLSFKFYLLYAAVLINFTYIMLSIMLKCQTCMLNIDCYVRVLIHRRWKF